MFNIRAKYHEKDLPLERKASTLLSQRLRYQTPHHYDIVDHLGRI
jgi:hypothetical protein